MFFELGEIQKIQTGISTLVDLKQKLDRKCLETFSSNPQRIDQSLKNTLTSVLQQSEKTLGIIKDIEQQVDMGYFVPTSLSIDQLVYDPSQLPEWFEFVFKKQYQKQKKNLDGLCKKAYKMNSLDQVRHNLQKEIQSFRLLSERYQIVSQKEKSSLNIMGEAEIVSKKCKCAREKYNNFCKSIATKIVAFLEESVSKSMNFSNSMNSIGQTVTNSFNVKLQPQQFQRGYLTNKFRQTNPALQSDGFYRSRAPKSVDFHGKTMYGRLGNDFGRTNNEFRQTGNEFGRTGNDFGKTSNGFGKTSNNGFGRTGMDFGRTGDNFGRYVPRHINSTVYDFYH